MKESNEWCPSRIEMQMWTIKKGLGYIGGRSGGINKFAS